MDLGVQTVGPAATLPGSSPCATGYLTPASRFILCLRFVTCEARMVTVPSTWVVVRFPQVRAVKLDTDAVSSVLALTAAAPAPAPTPAPSHPALGHGCEARAGTSKRLTETEGSDCVAFLHGCNKLPPI